MRLTVVPPLLFVAAAALLMIGLPGAAPADRPGADPALVVVLEAPYDCPLMSIA